jgi:hypothetical protein
MQMPSDQKQQKQRNANKRSEEFCDDVYLHVILPINNNQEEGLSTESQLNQQCTKIEVYEKVMKG